MPVTELAEAFAADPAPDPAVWLADLAAAEIFGLDQPSDPFGPQTQ